MGTCLTFTSQTYWLTEPVFQTASCSIPEKQILMAGDPPFNEGICASPQDSAKGTATLNACRKNKGFTAVQSANTFWKTANVPIICQYKWIQICMAYVILISTSIY